jgi:two-component system chemotaxis sensor kinase CheA
LDDLVIDFIAETREGLESLDSELVRFEQRPDDPSTLGEIFRLVHTIKGTCGFLGLSRLQTVAHHAENVLGGFRDGTVVVTPAAVSAILETVDLIRTLVDALGVDGAEPTGDDSTLIARLESVQEPVAAEPAGATPAAPAPAPAGPPLIERLGGDALLDAAVEMALPRLAMLESLRYALADSDPDLQQGGLRDALSELARKQIPTGAFQRAFEALGVAGLDGASLSEAFCAIADGLTDMDVDSGAVEQLRILATAPTDVAEASPAATVSEMPPPATASVKAAAPASPSAAAEPAVARNGDGGLAQTIRVSVDALEHLMTVVSELVLIRNQLIQTLRLEPESPFAAPLNRLNQVTSELQEGVMTTRMQPISGAWAKLPRLVRDLAQDLGKSIDLVMTGQETELDRQVLELIKDPLTHMIRNAADHGLETPDERRAAGKSASGRITLHARHEGGAILIDVADDGRGLASEKIRAKAMSSGLITGAQAEQLTEAEACQLIFLPGFSTAAQVTSVSGRGVGMDVVRTNIEKIGGTIEVSSVEGSGTRFVIRIPLTLTIVSALIVECCGERFALPQASLVELVSASGASGHAIEQLEGTAVLRLRDRLLPLVSLQQLLKLEPVGEPTGETCIVVARVGAFTYGVIVDRVFDTEEIVVKPVATVLRHVKLYSGATILGDGSVILILDPKGISLEAGATTAAGNLDGAGEKSQTLVEDRKALLVFRDADEALKAAPLAAVSRIEEIEADQIECVNGRTVLQYRGRLMPILAADAQPAQRWASGGRRPLLVFARGDETIGMLVEEIVDIVEIAIAIDPTSASEGALGSLIVAERATALIDVEYYWRRLLGEERAQGLAAPPAAEAPKVASAKTPAPAATALRRLLLIDASSFSQLLLQPLLGQAGYDVVVAASPEAALELYNAGERFQLIMADAPSEPAAAKAFARSLGQAKDWGATPLLSLALTGVAGQQQTGLEKTTLLAAVEAALEPLQGAA